MMTEQENNIGETFMNEGRSLLESQHYAESITAYNKALLFIPTATSICFYRSKAHLALENFQQALADINLYRNDAPFDQCAMDLQKQILGKIGEEFMDEGRILLEATRYEESIIAYDKALDLIPTATSICFYRSKAHLALGNYQQALADINTYRNDAPLDQCAVELQKQILGKIGERFMNEGRSLLDSGKYSESIIAYNKALELIPTATSICFYRGKTHFFLGNYQQALSDINAYRNDAPLDQCAVELQNQILGKINTKTRRPSPANITLQPSKVQRNVEYKNQGMKTMEEINKRIEQGRKRDEKVRIDAEVEIRRQSKRLQDIRESDIRFINHLKRSGNFGQLTVLKR